MRTNFEVDYVTESLFFFSINILVIYNRNVTDIFHWKMFSVMFDIDTKWIASIFFHN